MNKPTRVGRRHPIPKVVANSIQDALIATMIQQIAEDAEDAGIILDWKTISIRRLTDVDHTTLFVELDATEPA